jgi:hypothetical protein
MQELIRFRAYKIGDLPLGARFYFLKDKKKQVWYLASKQVKKWRYGISYHTKDMVSVRMRDCTSIEKEVTAVTGVIFLNSQNE